MDHEYVGNVCSGFGGTTECQWIDMKTAQRCGRSPGAHTKEFADLFPEESDGVR